MCYFYFFCVCVSSTHRLLILVYGFLTAVGDDTDGGVDGNEWPGTIVVAAALLAVVAVLMSQSWIRSKCCPPRVLKYGIQKARCVLCIHYVCDQQPMIGGFAWGCCMDFARGSWIWVAATIIKRTNEGDIVVLLSRWVYGTTTGSCFCYIVSIVWLLCLSHFSKIFSDCRYRSVLWSFEVLFWRGVGLRYLLRLPARFTYTPYIYIHTHTKTRLAASLYAVASIKSSLLFFLLLMDNRWARLWKLLLLVAFIVGLIVLGSLDVIDTFRQVQNMCTIFCKRTHARTPPLL